MASGNGDSPDPTMHSSTVQFLRLLPSPNEAGPLYESGVALFLRDAEGSKDNYLLTLSAEDAKRLANNLNDYLAGKLDITR